MAPVIVREPGPNAEYAYASLSGPASAMPTPAKPTGSPSTASSIGAPRLSKNPGDWEPSSQNGVLLRCVSFYLTILDKPIA